MYVLTKRLFPYNIKSSEIKKKCLDNILFFNTTYILKYSVSEELQALGPLSAMDFFVVNKATFVTVMGTILTYYFVLMGLE